MSTATFLQKYRILNKIGEGSFSEVLKCQDLKVGSFLAAKRLKKRFNSWDEVNECAEVIAMHKLPKHSNILHMTEFHFDSLMGKVTFLFELMDMSLYDFINMRKKHVHEARAKYYLYQILCGLYHLHKNGMFHRDIKPENILLKLPIDDNYESVKYETIKIADLGSLRGIYSSPPFTEYISTRWYRSPECLLTSGFYGPKMDIWATGCVFYELLTFKPLFAGSNEVDQLSKIHKILGTPSKRTMTKFLNNKSCNFEYFPKQFGKGISQLLPNISPEGQTILKLMVTYDPDSRCNVRRLLDNKYFKHLRESDNMIRRKRSTLILEPVGDFKSSSFNSGNGRKTPTPQNKVEKRLKRSYNEIYNTKKISSKEKETKVDHKRPKRSYVDIVAAKKFKPSDSCESLIVKQAVPQVKKHKISDSYKNMIKEATELKEPRTVFQTKNGKTSIETFNDVKPDHTHIVRKYIKAKKEYETYRNTTGNIPQIFHKHSEKAKSNPISKSFVEKKTVKYMNSNSSSFDSIMELRPKHPKVYVVDPGVKTLRKNRKL